MSSQHIRTPWLSLALVGICAAMVGGTGSAQGAPQANGNGNGNPNGADNHQITICQRTRSITNPYVVITVDQDAADGDLSNDSGQGDHYMIHHGPVFDPAIHTSSGQEWGDIIPPIPGIHGGRNWNTEGRSVYNNGCSIDIRDSAQDTEIPAECIFEGSTEQQVAICHSTRSLTNPYNVIYLDTTTECLNLRAIEKANEFMGSAYFGKDNHYLSDKGPVFDSETHIANGDSWGDIIPPIAGVHDGRNWDAHGQAVWNNGCTFSEPNNNLGGDALLEARESFAFD